MSPRILQTNYRLEGTLAEYKKENQPYAEPIARTPGLRWKVWLVNEETNEAGGISEGVRHPDGAVGRHAGADRR